MAATLGEFAPLFGAKLVQRPPADYRRPRKSPTAACYGRWAMCLTDLDVIVAMARLRLQPEHVGRVGGDDEDRAADDDHPVVPVGAAALSVDRHQPAAVATSKLITS